MILHTLGTENQIKTLTLIFYILQNIKDQYLSISGYLTIVRLPIYST